jgi:hypothetical protein
MSSLTDFHCMVCQRTRGVPVVRDHNGQQLAYIYFEDEPERRSAAQLLMRVF